jgi:hypothetical protein
MPSLGQMMGSEVQSLKLVWDNKSQIIIAVAVDR